MADKTLSVTLRVRSDTAANWASANPILSLGELGYDSSNRILKSGDGATTWNNLTGINMGTGSVSVDSAFSKTSLNPLENSILSAVINNNEISIGRKADSTTGAKSVAIGLNAVASGDYSTAIGGGQTTDDSGTLVDISPSATAQGSTAFNAGTASGTGSAAFNFSTASGAGSAAFGKDNTASGDLSVAFGLGSTASGAGSAAFGAGSTASGAGSAAFGAGTASGAIQLTCGRYNVVDAGATSEDVGTYLFIVGNGADDTHRSNAFAVKTGGGCISSDYNGIGISICTALPSSPNWHTLYYVFSALDTSGTLTAIYMGNTKIWGA